MSAIGSIHSQALRANIRAELARQEVDWTDLIPVLKLSRNSVYARMRGDRPFTTDEIAAIAAYLGMPPADLWPAENAPAVRHPGEVR